MIDNLTIETPPATEPITVAEAKSHLRISSSAEDTLLGIYITAARKTLELWMNRTFVTTTYIYYMDCEPPTLFELPRPPLASVTSIKYIDTSGDEQTVTGSVYTADTGAEPGRISLAFNQTWPSARDVINRYYVEYKGGYGDIGAQVNWIKQCILLLVGTYYENREASTTLRMEETPLALQSLVWAHRVKLFK